MRLLAAVVNDARVHLLCKMGSTPLKSRFFMRVRRRESIGERMESHPGSAL